MKKKQDVKKHSQAGTIIVVAFTPPRTGNILLARILEQKQTLDIGAEKNGRLLPPHRMPCGCIHKRAFTAATWYHVGAVEQ